MKSVFSDRYAVLLRMLIAARKEKSLTQTELANCLDKPQSFVSKYERGERRLDFIEFLDICQVVALDPTDAIKRIEQMPAKS